MRRTVTKPWLLILIVIGASLSFAGSCEDDSTPQKNESQLRQDSYERLTKEQPAHSMNYSPSRDTINFWIDTWGKQPGKLAYVYLQAANGQLIGYYIFKGLPVSYCAALTPTYEFVGTPKDDSDDQNQQVPAPGVDGVYYSGGQCAAYYGKDATTGQYMEYTVGQGISALIYERPLPRQDVEPLGFSKVDDVK
jgi:hypothetical protein